MLIMSNLFSSFSRNIIFPLQAIRERSNMPGLLAEFERSQFKTPEQIADLQFARLKSLLIHAHRNCTFYRELFDRSGFDPQKMESPEDIRMVPVLTKSDIQQNRDRMKAANFDDASLVADRTGGSTGRPLNFYMDKRRFYSRNAAAIRHDRWTGWDIGDRSAYMWGHRGDMMAPMTVKSRLRNILLDRRIVLDTSSINRRKLAAFKDELRRYRPRIYVAYANSAYLFSRYLKETGSTDHHRPDAIVTSAELLESQQRELIEEVFSCRVFDRYGSRETSIIASECDYHTSLHICAEALYLEFLREGERAAGETTGKIVVTDLLNYGMPFIRYQIEDVGSPVTGQCSCGRGLPMMKMVGGRVTDFLVTPEGKMISGASLTIYLIANAPGVAQAQIIQENKNEITIKVVKNEGFGDDSLRFFDREIPRFFGNLVKYEIEFVDDIPVESSGKYRFSISKVDPAEMF